MSEQEQQQTDEDREERDMNDPMVKLHGDAEAILDRLRRSPVQNWPRVTNELKDLADIVVELAQQQIGVRDYAIGIEDGLDDRIVRLERNTTQLLTEDAERFKAALEGGKWLATELLRLGASSQYGGDVKLKELVALCDECLQIVDDNTIEPTGDDDEDDDEGEDEDDDEADDESEPEPIGQA
jgi:hypothetical protein